jgi:hypothetical protein
VELVFLLRAIETMQLLAWEDVVLLDERPYVSFDLGGDPEAGAGKQGLDLL